jgi:transcriptional regulator with PAS, ATPase and Fis domain
MIDSRPMPGLLPGVVGSSAPLRAVVDQVAMVAGTEVTCLVTGETGTGKELFARGIHYLSRRRHQPFVPVNCGAIPDHLFENELFGHTRGAYTDARSNEGGILAYAEKGTLFLDEVDSLSLSAQVKLLRVLQEREYRPVGSAHTVATNIRIVAATNCNLENAVQARRFREDLYFRLNVFHLRIPPLRDRLEDVPALALRYVREYSLDHQRTLTGIQPEAMDLLRGYHWPGNVRELQTVIQRAVILARNSVITAADLDLPAGIQPMQAHMTLKAAKTVAVNQCERSYLSTVLACCEGNVTQAARMAGKERRSFQRLLKKHAVSPLVTKNSRQVS